MPRPNDDKDKEQSSNVGTAAKWGLFGGVAGLAIAAATGRFSSNDSDKKKTNGK